jgi:hypothetical protein
MFNPIRLAGRCNEYALALKGYRTPKKTAWCAIFGLQRGFQHPRTIR